MLSQAFTVFRDKVGRHLDLPAQICLSSCQDPQPVLAASVEEIRVGLTRDFSLRCSFANLAAHDVSQIERVDLFHVKGISDDFDLLASVTIFSSAETVPPGQNNVVVSGSVNGPEAYLEISWEHPTHSFEGQYSCIVSALGLTGIPVHFSRIINVTAVDSTDDELVARIQKLETDLSHLNFSCQNTTQNLVNTSQELMEIRQQLLNMSQELINARQEIEILKSPASCEEANLTSGQQIVQLNLDSRHVNPINVICELRSDGQIWTMFQRRFGQSLDFNRSYAEYENGFGSLQGEFWLGLKNMVRIMGTRPCELRVDMVLNNQSYTRIYTSFALNPVDYTLTVGGYDDGGEGLSYNSGQAFYTYDRDSRPSNCAKMHGGGWWYTNCHFVNLNANLGINGFSWFELAGNFDTLSSSEMQFRHKTQ